MNEYLLIENFGPIDEVILDDIRPLTIFIGESGSGKSTLLNCISTIDNVTTGHIFIDNVENTISYNVNEGQNTITFWSLSTST